MKTTNMKQVILDPPITRSINLDEIHMDTPIFAYKNGVLKGLIVEEDKGWILRLGGSLGSNGHYPTREECMARALRDFNYAFYTPTD